MTLYEPPWFLKLVQLHLSDPPSAKEHWSLWRWPKRCYQHQGQISGTKTHRGKKYPQESRTPWRRSLHSFQSAPGEGKMHHLLFQKIAADRNRTGPLKCVPGCYAKEAVLNILTSRLHTEFVSSVLVGKTITTWMWACLGARHHQICHTHFRVWLIVNKVISGTVYHILVVLLHYGLIRERNSGSTCDGYGQWTSVDQ